MTSLATVLATVSPVFAQQTTQPPTPSAGLASLLPMMLVMFLVIFFLIIRPEQKKQKQRLAMLNALKKGDRVITVAGILGTVGNVKENTVMVKIAENTVVEFTKNSISSVINKDGSEKQNENPKEEK